MNDEKKIPQTETTAINSLFEIRKKQYKNTSIISLVLFIFAAGIFAGGLYLVFYNPLGILLMFFSFIILFIAVVFLGVYIQSRKVIIEIKGFIDENNKVKIKEYAKNATADTKLAYYQFLFGTCALVDIGSEDDIPFFAELLEETTEKNKPMIKAFLNFFAQKYGFNTFKEFQEGSEK